MKIYAIILTLSLICMHTAISNTHLSKINDEISSINKLTHLTFRRYYFIARLERTIKLLATLNAMSNELIMKKIVDVQFNKPFTHKLIHQAAIRIQQSKSIKPIFAVWDEFSSYKSLESELIIGKNDLFVKEFSQQLFFIVKNFITVTRGYSIIDHYKEEEIDSLSHEQMLDLLDNTMDIVENRTNNTIIKRLPDIKIHATADEINTRYYYLKRLEHTILLLEHIDNLNPNFFQNNIKRFKPLNVYDYRNDAIQHTIQEMLVLESHNPLFKSWQDFRQYRKISDQTFAKELCILIFNVLKTYNHNAQSPSLSLLENTEIEDILYAIDIISDEIKTTIEKYNQEEISLSQWIKKYWWVPLGTLGTISLKLAYYYAQKTNFMAKNV